MPVSILPRRKSKIGSLTIEATLSEQHSMTSTVTKFPVEDGKIVSDHIINDPEKVTLDCMVSNTPLDDQPSNFAQDAFDALNQMWEARALVDVITQYKVYSDMAITDITVPRNNKTGDAINFSVSLTKIRKVQATTVTVYQDTLAAEVVDQASSTINLGNTPTGPSSNLAMQLAYRYIKAANEGVA